MRKNKSMLTKTIFYGIGVSLFIGSLVVPLGIDILSQNVVNNPLVRENASDNKGIKIAKNSSVDADLKEKPFALSPTAVNQDLGELFNIDVNGELSVKNKPNLENYLEIYDGKLDLNKLGDKVEVISSWCFDRLENLSEITISKSVTEIGNDAFFSCKSLKKVTFAENSLLREIGHRAFGNDNNLKSVSAIPSSVTNIGMDAFMNCVNLEKITFAENSQLNEIGQYAFSSTKLKNITIPDLVTTIGEGAFNNCGYLEKVIFNEDSKLKIISSNIFLDCKELNDINIPDSVVEIGGKAFENCKKLVNIKICNLLNLKSIGNFAFRGAGLESVIIPKNVTYIGVSAFANCDSLKEVTFMGTEKRDIDLGKDVFVGDKVERFLFESQALLDALKNKSDAGIDEKKCELIQISKNDFEINGDVLTGVKGEKIKKISTLNLSDLFNDGSLSSIGDNAFENYINLESITLPTSLTKIGNRAFEGCKTLKSVNFSDLTKLESIGESAFFKCKSLGKIDIPLSVTTICLQAFQWCSELKEVSFGKDSQIQTISNSVFSGCKSLKSIRIPNLVTKIEKNSFLNCKNLENVDFGDKLCEIDNFAFHNTGLKSVIIPKSVTNIGEGAFGECTSLKEVTFMGTEKRDIDLGKDVFVGDKVERFLFESQALLDAFLKNKSGAGIDEKKCFVMVAEGYFSLNNGCLSVNLQSQPGVKEQRTLDLKKLFEEKGVNGICDGAFQEYQNLTKIILPTSLTKIGNTAFNGCKSLADVNFDDLINLKTIGDSAFSYTCLDSITIPNKVDSIGVNAFLGCKNLKKVTIPQSVKKIDAGAFSDCNNLKTVRFEGDWGDLNQCSIDLKAFSGLSNISKIYVDKPEYVEPLRKKLAGELKDKVVVFSSVTLDQAVGVDKKGLLEVNNAENLRKYLAANFKVLDLTDLKCVSNLKEIDANVFSDNNITYEQMKSIVIPDNAAAIENVSLPESVAIVNKSPVLFNSYVNFKKSNFNIAFLNLSILKNDENKDFITIANGTFDGFTDITSVVIPASITDIGANAFSGCTSLKEVTFMGKNRGITIGENAFMKDRVEKFLFEDQALLGALKNKSDAGIDPVKCSLITSGLSDGAIVGITLATIFASVCFTLGIIVLFKRKSK